MQVLKFITCDRLFELHPSDHEGRLALRKDAVVSNVALAQVGQQLQLQQHLTTPFQCASVCLSEQYRARCSMYPVLAVRLICTTCTLLQVKIGRGGARRSPWCQAEGGVDQQHPALEGSCQ